MKAADGQSRIDIRELELFLSVGLGEAERRNKQRVTVSLTMWPARGFHDLADDVANTVDYAQVCTTVEEFVSDRSDKLIETVVIAIATHVLENFPLAAVEVELRKFVLPNTRYVSVTTRQERVATS